jgi:hypothetical protein
MHCLIPHGPFCRANIWKLPEFGTGSELDDDALAAIREATVTARGLCGDVTLLDAAEKVLARGAAAAALTAALQQAVEARYMGGGGGLGLGRLLLLRPTTRHTPIASKTHSHVNAQHTHMHSRLACAHARGRYHPCCTPAPPLHHPTPIM